LQPDNYLTNKTD